MHKLLADAYMCVCHAAYLLVGPKIKGFSMCVFCIHTTQRLRVVTVKTYHHICDIRFNP